MWWEYIVVPVLLVLGIYGFLVFTGLETRFLTRKTGRTADSMYGNYAGLTRKQRRQARKRSHE